MCYHIYRKKGQGAPPAGGRAFAPGRGEEDLAGRKTAGKVAGKTEVLEYLTAVVRGDCPGGGEGGGKPPDGKDRLRAAELLGRHLGLFAEPGGGQAGSVTLVGDVGHDKDL